MNKCKEHFYLFIFLLFVIILNFYKVCDGSNVYVGGDTLSPVAFRFGINEIISSHLSYPLWFPWIFGGMPSIHSFINVSNHYLPHHIFLFLNNLGLPWVWNFLLHLIFCGIGMYSLLRYMKCSRYASLFSASLFMICPYFVAMTSFGHGSQVMTASYIPWIILFLFRIYNKLNLLNFSIFSLLIGMQLQRAHIQIAYYTWMMIGLYILFINYSFIKNKSFKILHLVKHNLIVLLSLLFGFLLSINIYWPALKYVENSTRASNSGGAGLNYATQWSLSLKETATFIIPSFLGFGGKLYWGDMPFTDYPNYIGLIILFFAIIGYCKSRISYQHKIFFLITLIFSFCISLGSNFISFYKIFYYYFPFFNKFRVPVYILILTFFSLFIFSSFGIDYLYQKIKLRTMKLKNILVPFLILLIGLVCLIPLSNHFISELDLKHELLNNLVFNDLLEIIGILFLFITLFSFFIFKKSLTKHFFYLSILFLCLFDYSRVNHEIIFPQKHIPHKKIIQPKEYLNNYLFKNDIISYLHNDKSKYRIYDIVGPQNRWAAFNIENVQGYHPAKINIYNKLLDSINKRGFNIWPEGILKLLNVKYLIMPFSDFSSDSFKIIKNGSMHYFGNQYNEYDGKIIPYYIYKYKNHYPRLFFVKKLEFIKENVIFDKILDTDFDPKETSYIDIDKVNEFNFEYNMSSLVDIISWSPNLIEFSTDVKKESFLLFSEVYYPEGWNLISDNKNYHIYNVNGIARGALIPPGKKYFKMYFEPRETFYSNIFSKISLFLIILLIIIGTYRKIKYNVK